jgi:hypothetical protein
MPWYVFALADRVPRVSAVRGFTSAVTFRPAAELYAAVERRRDVPPPEMNSLQRHQRLVERLAARVPAILPVRFGTLLTADELEESIEARREDIAEALDLVRDRRQMTWRLRGSPERRSAREASVPFDAISGAEYLRRAAHPTSLSLPPGLRRVRTALGPLAAAERESSPRQTMAPALYHLVDRALVGRYVAAAEPIRARYAQLTLSGPWAPYAFAPEPF